MLPDIIHEHYKESVILAKARLSLGHKCDCGFRRNDDNFKKTPWPLCKLCDLCVNDKSIHS